MEPWQSWAIALLGGGAAYLYYNNQQKPNNPRARTASVSDAGAAPQAKPTKRREERKAHKANEGSEPITTTANGSATTSGKDKAISKPEQQPGKKRKAGKQANAPTSAPPAAAKPVGQNDADDEDDGDNDDDNKAWAEQMANLKKGTTLSAPSRNDSRMRTVKQKALGTNSGLSSASSDGGAHADDDVTTNVAAGDVSDMLEPTPAGPNVLRVTESANPSKPRQARPQKEEESAESKKQRQNRKKVEERRIAREAEEKERQAKLEAQRRTARAARGEPARNGVAPAPKPPSSSAWSAGAPPAEPAQSSAPNASTGDGALLDTFEPQATSTANTNRTNAASSSSDTWGNGLPTEEDQMKLATKASEDESGWNTVAKSKKQKKATAPSDVDNSDSSSPVIPAPAQKQAAPASKPVAATNGFSSLVQDSTFDAGSHPDDSQWGA